MYMYMYIIFKYMSILYVLSNYYYYYSIDPTSIMSVNPITVNSYIGDPFHLNCTVTHDTLTTVALSWTRNGTQITDTTILTPIGEVNTCTCTYTQ